MSTKKKESKKKNPKTADKPTAESEEKDSVTKAKEANKQAAKDAYASSAKTNEEIKIDKEVGEQAEEKTAPEEPDYKLVAQKTAAEFENFRKRVTREKAEWKRDALADFLKEFLPAFDDLDRAIKEGEKGHSYEVIHDGAKLVRDNLWKTLVKEGVQEIDAADKPFNPRYHEAMTMIPMPDKEPNSVIEVFQPGYMIGDFVLRPAKVVVAAEQ